MERGQIAAALGGEIRDGSVLAPGPGHSRRDRSLSVKPDPNAPDGFLVHSFAGDDAIACKDYVRKKCGTPAFAQNDNGSGKRRRRRTSEEIQAAMAAIIATDRPPTPKGVHTHTYDYVDADGLLVNQVLRYEQPKSFRQRRDQMAMAAGYGGLASAASPIAFQIY
jgi:hypothetical protein